MFGSILSGLGFEYRYFEAYSFTKENIKTACKQRCEQLISSGANIFFDTELEKIEKEDSNVVLRLKKQEEATIIRTQRVILAIGRAGRGLLKYECRIMLRSFGRPY